MKRSWILTFALMVSGCISLFLTYTLIFGSPTSNFTFLINESNKARTSETVIKNPAFEITRMQVFLPTMAVYHKEEVPYIIQNSAAIEQSMRSFDLAYNTSDSLKIVEDPVYFNDVLSEKSWEYVFASPVPIQQLSYMLEGIETVSDELLVDRIVLSDREQSLYFLNTQNYRVAQVLLPSNTDIGQYVSPLQALAEEAVPAVEVSLRQGKMYVPSTAPVVPTYVYTLKRQTDAAYIAKFFEKQSYQLSSTNKENEKKYFTIDHSLTIDGNDHLYSAKVTVLQNRKSATDNQLALDSFNVYKLFETWTEGVRYVNDHKQPMFQRYLHNYPVVSAGVRQYAVQTFEMQPRATTVIGTTLNLHLHIDDMSENHQLVDFEAVQEILKKAKHMTQDYDRIYVGYVWQKEMEDFQLATYVPAWIFEVDGQVYQLVQGQDKLERIGE